MNLAIFEGVSVIAALVKEFELDFAPGYLDERLLEDLSATPRYSASLTLPMVRLLSPLKGLGLALRLTSNLETQAGPLLVKVARRKA
jgi:hypothetical protein